MLKEKMYGGYYLLTESSTRDGALGVSGSSKHDRAPGIGGLSMRWKTQENDGNIVE